MKSIFKTAAVTSFLLLPVNSMEVDEKEAISNKFSIKNDESKKLDYGDDDMYTSDDERHKDDIKARERKEASELADKMWGLKTKKYKKDKE